MSNTQLTASVEASDIVIEIDLVLGSVSVKMNAEVRGHEEEVDETLDVDPEEAMSLTVGEIVSQAWRAHERW